MDSTEYFQRWCQICRQLRQALLQGGTGGTELRLRFASVKALVDSAAAGCPVCCILRQQLAIRPRSFDYPSYRSMLNNVNLPPVLVHMHWLPANSPSITLKVGSGRRPSVNLRLQGNTCDEGMGFETLPVGSYRQRMISSICFHLELYC
jgi:hypothetical protein